MNATTIGLDIAKSVLQVHGVDGRGQVTLQRRLRRGQVLGFFANLPRCLVGVEACAGAHHSAREICKLGHEVKLMPPQFIKPYVKTNKNDARDAEAIFEAIARPNMRFVAIKTIERLALGIAASEMQSSTRNKRLAHAPDGAIPSKRRSGRVSQQTGPHRVGTARSRP